MAKSYLQISLKIDNVNRGNTALFTLNTKKLFLTRLKERYLKNF
ncbi:hypothetical protein Flavo103_43710 [Flavobacterium collinsii]|nr:hypothetical protein Flavo103_43710 [Flavobacterium collinsii]